MEAEIIAETANLFKRRFEFIQDKNFPATPDHQKASALKIIAELTKQLEAHLVVGVNNRELLGKLKNAIATFKIFKASLSEEEAYEQPSRTEEAKFNEGFNTFFLKNEQTLFPVDSGASVKSITDEHETVRDREQERLIRHFADQYQGYLRNLKKVNAVELFNNIISSDDHLRFIHKVLRQLEDTMVKNNQQFAHLFSQFELIKDQHKQDAIYRDIYSKDVSIGSEANASELYKIIEIILIESAKSGNMISVQESLRDLDLEYFADFLNLTLPAHSRSLTPLSPKTTILDFMLNNDFKKLISHDDVNNCTMTGNSNWILIFIFICNKSRIPRSKFNKLLSLIACRDDHGLADHFKLDLESFWLQLRNYFNTLVIRKYIVARKIFSKVYLPFEESGEIDELFKKSCDTIYNTIFNNEDEDQVEIIYQSNFDSFIRNLAKSFPRHTSLMSIIELPFLLHKLATENPSCNVYDIKAPAERSLLDVFNKLGVLCDGHSDYFIVTCANYINLLMPFLTSEITDPNQKLIKAFGQYCSANLKGIELVFFFNSFITDTNERIEQFARLIAKEKDKTFVREIKKLLPQYFTESEVDTVLIKTTETNETLSEIEVDNRPEVYAQTIRNRMAWLLSDTAHFISAFNYAFGIFMKDLKNENYERACEVYNGVVFDVVFYQRSQVKDLYSHPKYKNITEKVKVYNSAVDAIAASILLEYQFNRTIGQLMVKNPEAFDQEVHTMKVA